MKHIQTYENFRITTLVDLENDEWMKESKFKIGDFVVIGNYYRGDKTIIGQKYEVEDITYMGKSMIGYKLKGIKYEIPEYWLQSEYEVDAERYNL
jgi:hypothetical protein